MLLKNSVVLITGASAGIGEACAHAFAAEGARLILTARRIEKLQTLARELFSKYESQVQVIAMDVRNSSSVNAGLLSLPEELQSIDLLINNAGLVIGLNKAHETPEDDVDVMVDTNIKGILNLQREIVPGMIARGHGTIINISSISGVQSYAGGAVYCGTKYAVNGITNSLRMDLVDTPLRVATISPGLVETEFSEVRFKGDKQKAASVYQGYDPLQARDIAETAVFIATRPPHVQIADVLILPTAQAAATLVHRKS